MYGSVIPVENLHADSKLLPYSCLQIALLIWQCVSAKRSLSDVPEKLHSMMVEHDYTDGSSCKSAGGGKHHQLQWTEYDLAVNSMCIILGNLLWKCLTHDEQQIRLSLPKPALRLILSCMPRKKGLEDLIKVCSFLYTCFFYIIIRLRQLVRVNSFSFGSEHSLPGAFLLAGQEWNIFSVQFISNKINISAIYKRSQ